MKKHTQQDDGKRVLILYKDDGDSLEIVGKKGKDNSFRPNGCHWTILPSAIPEEYSKMGFNHAQVVRPENVQGALKDIWKITHPFDSSTRH